MDDRSTDVLVKSLGPPDLSPLDGMQFEDFDIDSGRVMDKLRKGSDAIQARR